MTRILAAKDGVRAPSAPRGPASRRAGTDRAAGGSPAGSPLFLRAAAIDGGAEAAAFDRGGPMGGPAATVHRTCTACQPDEPCPECAAREGIQASLTVSVPGDRAEVEAERVAEHIMRSPDPVADIASGDDAAGVALSAPAAAAGGTAARQFQVPPRHTGRPLQGETRRFFEARFRRDFGAVRIHDDRAAADSARHIHARAYTHGDQIVFAQGQYAPDHAGGRRLLAHELTHVVQQRAAAPQIDRTPEDAARLNQLPFSAHRTRPHLAIAFHTVWAEATGDLPAFADRVQAACLESVEGLSLDAGQSGAIAQAAAEIADLTDEADLGAGFESFTLATAVRALAELMPSDPSDVQATSFGFEYVYGRLVTHAADFVALSLQEHAHGAEIDADAALSAAAARSQDAYVQLFQDLQRIVAALADGRSLLMLELEGLVSALVALREEFDPRGTRDDQQQNYERRSELARRALLVNRRLMQMTDEQTAPTPLDESVRETLGDVRRTARSEADTRAALGDRMSLLAAQPLNMAERVDDPFFEESGLGEQAESEDVAPQVAFPETTGRFARGAQEALAARIDAQSETLRAQLNRIVPPPQESSYSLDEFARVHRHWFSLFGIEKERTVMEQAGAMDIWRGIHQATAIGTLSVSGDVMTAWLRYQTMKQAVPLLGLFVGTGVDREFGELIDAQRLRRRQTLSGGSASAAAYEFGELYDGKAPLSAAGETSSRETLAAAGARTTAAGFSQVARLPGSLQTPAAHQQGLTPQPLPVLGLRTVQAKEGWTYLIAVPDYLSDDTIAYEQKTATPEVAEFLLAQRQHAATLKTTHSALVSVASPGRSANTTQLRHVGPVPALEGAATPASATLARADRTAREAIGMPGRDSTTRAPSGTALVEAAALDYLDAFFRAGDSATRVAGILHLMNVEHGAGQVFDRMLDPLEIAKVLGKAFGLGFGLGVVASLGPIGRVLSIGIGKALKVTGGSDITAALTVTGFLTEAAAASTFVGARIMGYVGVPIVADIKQLFESVLSAPAAMAGSKAADAGVRAVLDRINQRPPATIAEAADLARELANASPEARADMLAAIDGYIADMEAHGVGRDSSAHDYDVMIAFRNAFEQQSTLNQMLDPFTTKLEPRPADGTASPFEASFRRIPAGERARLLGAMGDLAGKVMLFQDPTLGDSGTVRVHYDLGRVRIHHGSAATARDIELHMPTVRTLRRYEGVSGSIRIVLERAVRLLGFTQTPEYGTKGFEAELEVAKLTAIRDDLIAQQNAIDLNARRLIDAEVGREVIDRHIADVDAQIREHARNLDSVEAGVGFVAARKSDAAVHAETLGLGSAPDGHYWQLRENLLVLVHKDQTKPGFFLDQDVLKVELDKLARGEPANPTSAIRSVEFDKTAGDALASTLGVGTPRAGHHWRKDPGGALVLVRHDKDADHFWFDYDGFVKDAGKSKPETFIRPIKEKADSQSDSARFDATTWREGFIELGGDGTRTSFGKFTRVLRAFEVSEEAIIDRMQTTETGRSRGEGPAGLAVKTVRHGTKQYFIRTVILPYVTDAEQLTTSPRYQAMRDAGAPLREAEIAASHERLLEITRQLDSADIGSLGESWYKHWFGQADDRPQFEVTKEYAADKFGVDLKQDRSIDLLHIVDAEKADIFEIKNVSTRIGDREMGEMDAHIALQGQPLPVSAPSGGKAPIRKVRKVVWVILNPDFVTVKANVDFIRTSLEGRAFLEFRIYDNNGFVQTVTAINVDTVLPPLVDAAVDRVAP